MTLSFLIAKKRKTKALIAAILNFFIWGLGYLYIKKKITFGIFVLIGDIIFGYTLSLVNPLSQYTYSVFILAFLFLSIGFAYDAYKEGI